jgi:hypothetical protein
MEFYFMMVALIDNGSLEPAAHQYLRSAAAALSARTGVPVQALSWRHSDQIPAAELGGVPAWTLLPWVRAQLARGECEFVFVPFFVSAQGAIGSAVRRDLRDFQHEAYDFAFTFTDGIAQRGALTEIMTDRIRETIAARQLRQPAVIVVDHGGPSPASSALRDAVALGVRQALDVEISQVAAASMAGMEHAHNVPLLADQLALPGFDRGDVVIALLFLSPGRHAGANGDLVQIARAAEKRLPGLRCHLTQLLGTHPRVIESLAHALRETLATFQNPTAA